MKLFSFIHYNLRLHSRSPLRDKSWQEYFLKRKFVVTSSKAPIPEFQVYVCCFWRTIHFWKTKSSYNNIFNQNLLLIFSLRQYLQSPSTWSVYEWSRIVFNKPIPVWCPSFNSSPETFYLRVKYILFRWFEEYIFYHI